MKKLSYYLKAILSIFLKIIIAVLMGLASSFGNKPVKPESKDNKEIESIK